MSQSDANQKQTTIPIEAYSRQTRGPQGRSREGISTATTRGEGTYQEGPYQVGMDGTACGESSEFSTNLQLGYLEIQDGYVTNIHAVPCRANWDFYRTNTLPMQPPVRAVQKDGIKRIIIYDDPEELPYEAKLFE